MNPLSKLQIYCIEPWPTPCEHCPTMQCQERGIVDEETEEYKKWPEEDRRKMIFPCAWRPRFLCKGIWDELY